MENNEIILSYPYSGALYAFLSDELGSHYTKSENSYYKTLFGKHYQQVTELTLTLSILYDNIIMPRVDIPLPDYRKYEYDGYYFNSDLGIKCYSSCTEHSLSDYSQIREKIDRDMNDPQIMELLKKVPKINRFQIIREAHEEISLALLCNCRVMCSIGRNKLIQRLVEIDYQHESVNTSNTITINAIRNYKGITGLTFNPISLDDFNYIKSDKEVRNYSHQFTNIVHSFNSTTDPEKELLEAMANAMNISQIAKKTSGIFANTSSVLSISGLIPIVGSVTSAIGIGTDVTARTFDTIGTKNEWYQLTPKIIEKRNEKRIWDFINKDA